MESEESLIMIDDKIKNVIFDFGGILVNLDKEATLKAFRALGYDADAYIGTYAQKGPFAPLEAGLITEKEFVEEIRKQACSEVPAPEQICRAWNAMLTGIPESRLRMLISLKRRYRLFLLSNTNIIHWKYSEPFFAFEGRRPKDYFERIYLSYECHLVKPDKAFFQKVLMDNGLIPDETLFIDDSADNCRVAAELGIHTFCSNQSDDWQSLFK